MHKICIRIAEKVQSSRGILKKQMSEETGLGKSEGSFDPKLNPLFISGSVKASGIFVTRL